MSSAPAFVLRLLTVSLAAGVSVLSGCQFATDLKAKEKDKGPPPKPQVFFVRPVQDQVEEYEEFPGRTWATNTVEVRARVTGYLNKVNFVDGAVVEKNKPLAEIDDRSFLAEVAQAKAAVAQAKARFDKLVKQERRASNLLQTGVRAMTQEEYEQIVADKDEAEAAIDAAEAALKIAELNLSYTKVEAPLAGKISRRLVDPGNLVTADTTVLATIVEVDSIYVYFDIDERTVIRLKRLLSEGKIKTVAGSDGNTVEVQIAVADESAFVHRGTVDFLDNQLDPTTGTRRGRAKVKNEDGFFLPGMFVRLRFPIGEKHPALLVPEESLMTDQGQRQVYVINDKDEVESRRVTTGILVHGMREIREGIQSSDRVVATGLQRIKKKTPVDPVERPLHKDEDDPAKTASTP